MLATAMIDVQTSKRFPLGVMHLSRVSYVPHLGFRSHWRAFPGALALRGRRGRNIRTLKPAGVASERGRGAPGMVGLPLADSIGHCIHSSCRSVRVVVRIVV